MITLTDSTQAALRRIATAPATSDQYRPPEPTTHTLADGRHWETRDGDFFYPCFWQLLPSVPDLPEPTREEILCD